MLWFGIILCFAVVCLILLQIWRLLKDYKTAVQSRAELATALEQANEEYKEAVYQSKAQLQTLFNSMMEGVAIFDQNGQIQLVNQSLEKMFGLVLDIRGLTIQEALLHPDLAPLVERLKDAPHGVSLDIEIPGNPAQFFVANAASILDRDGKPQGGILVFHDMTGIRQLENARREFVANVSHELRTPLSLIKGYAETLLDGAANDPEVASRFLNKIEVHANRLTNLIEDLLTISKLESGRSIMRLAPLELKGFVAHILEDMQPRTRARQPVFINQLPQGMTVKADPDRLQQVFVNLLDNAVKYGKPGGTIIIKAVELPEGRIQVGVADDGPGIPPEAKERIFERFYRLDKARSRETGGTGLGLSIVKHIVQSHGGEVWVESELGHGSCFYFILPK